jgi:hypothetical protein
LGEFPQTLYEINKKRKKKYNPKLVMKEQDSTKMEFLLTLNDNIVVQRYFNVRGYNPKAKNSIEFYNLINEIKDDLQYHLKMKTVIYMTDNSDSIMHDPSVMDTSYTDGPEIFNIYVKNGDTTICHRIFDGKFFPPKVRYTVDVRPFLKDILRELTDIFSEQRLSYQYLDFDLSK